MSAKESRIGGRPATTGIIPGRYALSVGLPDMPCPKGWRWTLLTDVARLESGHTPSRRHPEYWDGEIPWIGVKDATNNHGQTLMDTLQHVTVEGLENSAARLLPAGTVCLSRTASIGYVVRMGRPMATSQDFVNWVCFEELNERFLMYVLMGEKDSYSRFAHGTTHQTIYFPEVKAFHICLPPRVEQDQIAELLGSIDDKISVNRRMNRTLEAMAQALFRSWFVDFDPVQAKVAGRQPEGMDVETAALFPNDFEGEGEHRRPKGWQRIRWSELVTLEYGKALRQYAHGDVPVFGTNGQIGFHDEPLCRHEGVIVGRKGAYRGIHFSAKPFYVIDTAFFVEPRVPLEMRWVYYELLQRGVNSLDSGSAIPSTSRADFYALQVVSPPYELQKRFVELLAPMWRQQEANEHEIRTLAELRDTLLPKLLSGEIRAQEDGGHLAASG